MSIINACLSDLRSIRSKRQIWKPECPAAHERTLFSTAFSQPSSSGMGKITPSADFNAFRILMRRLKIDD
jgi:hypothetical protein